MTVTVIGGDHLGGIPDNLKENGFHVVKHFSGRKAKHIKKGFTENCDLILVLTDYVSTNLSRTIKSKAKKHEIPVIFARRSWSCVYKEMNRINCNNCRSNNKCPYS